jgi:hypothetical protein
LILFGPSALSGWRVLSEIELPELLPWNEASGAGIPLRIERAAPGQLAAELPRPGFSPLGEAAAGGGLLHIPDLALYRIHPGGSLVSIAPFEDSDPLVVRAYLYGTVFAVLCFMRGVLPLHGAAVLADGGAIVLSGPSGAGKSTLATALAQRGRTLLSDDVCPLDLTDPTHPLLWPAFPRVKLREDAIAALGLDAATTRTRAPRGEKGHYGVAQLALEKLVTEAVPLAAVYALSEHSSDRPAAIRMTTPEAFTFINSQIHRGGIGRRLGLTTELFRQACTVAAAVPVYRLDRPRELERLAEVAALLPG